LFSFLIVWQPKSENFCKLHKLYRNFYFSKFLTAEQHSVFPLRYWLFKVVELDSMHFEYSDFKTEKN
jgi:hypothetical protein